MSWICPECEYENDDLLIRCVCGHEIDGVLTFEETKMSSQIIKPDLILKTRYNLHKIISILEEQIDAIPYGLQNINLFNFRGTSSICGSVSEEGFELRNRVYHMYSLRAYGEFVKSEEGTLINMFFKEPVSFNWFWGRIFNRFKSDQELIVNFLEEWLEVDIKR